VARIRYGLVNWFAGWCFVPRVKVYRALFQGAGQVMFCLAPAHALYQWFLVLIDFDAGRGATLAHGVKGCVRISENMLRIQLLSCIAIQVVL
jgi:hypothetical protein